MTKSAKPTSPFRLDMDPDEALERFIGASPKEVDANIARSKQKKPPGSKKPSGGSAHADHVVSLRGRRMRKRNTGR
jgi:hypothetical protein